MKIAILGYSGSGKSTLANFLSRSLNIPILYLDTVYFEAGWKERDTLEALAIVDEFMAKDGWIIDGNYISLLQSERLERADYIFYLSFSRINCLLRAFSRFMKYRNTTRDSMADGCEEKFDLEFVWWILYAGRTAEKRKFYDNVLSQYSSKSFVVQNQKQLNQIMNNLHIFIK